MPLAERSGVIKMRLWGTRRLRRRWLLWPVVLVWVLLWHGVLLPPIRHLDDSVFHAGLGPGTLLLMLLAYYAGFAVLGGLVYQGQRPIRKRRVAWAVVPLAVVAGLLDEALLYTLSPSPASSPEDVSRRLAVALLNGCVRALIIGSATAGGVFMARSTLGSAALTGAGLIAAGLLIAGATSGWFIMGR